METLQQQVSLHPEFAGLVIGSLIIVGLAGCLALVQKFNEWRGK